MYILHLIGETAVDYENYTLLITLKKEIASYILNTKRKSLLDIEQKYNVIVRIETDMSFVSPMDFRFEKLRNSTPRVQETTKQKKEQAKAEKKLKQKQEKAEKKQEKVKQEKLDKKQKKKNETVDVSDTPLMPVPAQQEESISSLEHEEETNKKHHRKRRNKRYPKSDMASKTEENFKVVEQDDLASFENQFQSEVAEEKQVKRSRKPRKKTQEDIIQPQEQSPVEEKKPPKKGWWNKLVS